MRKVPSATMFFDRANSIWDLAFSSILDWYELEKVLMVADVSEWVTGELQWSSLALLVQ